MSPLLLESPASIDFQMSLATFIFTRKKVEIESSKLGERLAVNVVTQ